MRRVMMENEMLIRRVRENAGAKGDGRSVSVRKIATGKLAQQRFVEIIGLTPQQVRCAALSAMMVAAKLETGNLIDGEAIIAPFLHVQIEDRESLGGKPFGTRRLQPRQHLPFRYSQAPCDRSQLANP